MLKYVAKTIDNQTFLD